MSKKSKRKDSVKSMIKAASKSKFKDDPNRMCEICGANNKTDIENHHLLRLSDLARMCISKKYKKYEKLYAPRVDLCHEHHNMWHRINQDEHINYRENPIKEMTLDEKERCYELIDSIEIRKAPKILKEEYKEIYKETKTDFRQKLDEIEIINEDWYFENLDIEELEYIENIYKESKDLDNTNDFDIYNEL